MSRVREPIRPGIGGFRIDRFDFVAFIHSVVSRYVLERGVLVTAGARQALIAPALEHEEHLQEEYKRRGITDDMLSSFMMRLLDHARDIAEQSRHPEIDREDVVEAMRLYCEIFPWR
jgi:hypothetical protein